MVRPVRGAAVLTVLLVATPVAAKHPRPAPLQKLTARKLDEATILAAWRGLGWTGRLRLDHAFHSATDDEIKDRLAFQNSFSISLGLSSADADGRIWLAQYVWSLAWIEG